MIRSVAIACLVYATAGILGKLPVTAEPNGKNLALGEYCYTMTAEKDGTSKPIGVTFQSIAREQDSGVDVLSIVVHQHTYDGKFDMRDSFRLRRDDLRPIRLDTSRNGAPYVHLDYTDQRITGWKMVAAVKRPIHVELSHPVWDGNLWGETFAALPLAAGAVLELPTYQYDSGLGSFHIEALDRHKEKTPAGVAPVWRVKADMGHSQVVEYTVSTHPGLEIGYAAGSLSQRPGGDCRGVR